MKQRNALIPILCMTALIGFSPPSSRADSKPVGMKPTDTKEQDAADIKALEDRFIAAFKAKDVDTIMQLCVPDDSLVVFDVTPPRQRTGAEAYRKDWENVFRRFAGPLQAEVIDLDITAGVDVAFATSIHHVTGTMRAGNKVDYSVRVTDCFKKINGKWLIAHTHVSFPVDMPTGKADMQSKP
jgi:uncharacterized protein (TIGR02246 family)